MKERNYGHTSQGKVIVCNIIMILVAAAAIVTLFIGSFMKISLTLTVNKETAQKIAGSNVDMSSISDFEVSIPITLDIKSKDLIKAGTGKSGEAAHELVQREVGNMIDTMMKKVDEILTSVTELIVDAALTKAEEEIAKQLDNTSEGAIGKELEEKYGVTKDDVSELKQDVSEAAKALLNGEADQVATILANSEVFDKLIGVYAESAAKSDKGSDSVTPEEIEAKKQQLKNEIIDKYEQTIDQFEAENGKISKETIVVGLVNSAELKDENGDTVKCESVDDVKKVLSDKVTETVEQNGKTVEYVLMGMGIFTLVVIASWAYLVLKILVKFFMKNKTVGMFFPRFFGWMPHVFFVAIPMTIVKFSDYLMKYAAKLGEQAEEMLRIVLDTVSLNVTSLTWVSALCTVILLVIWIPYYQWRRRIKRELKSGR